MFDGNFETCASGRTFDSGYVPVEEGLTLKDIKDRHELFIPDNNILVIGLDILTYMNSNPNKNFSKSIKACYGQLKTVFELASEGKLKVLEELLEEEYLVEKIFGYKKNDGELDILQDESLSTKEALRLSLIVGNQLALEQYLRRSSISFKSLRNKEVVKAFFDSKICVREYEKTKNKTKLVSDIDLMTYSSALTQIEEGKDCVILSNDPDLLAQKPTPRRMPSNKARRKLRSQGFCTLPKYFKSPTIYCADNSKRFRSGLPNTFLRYENPKSHEIIRL